MMKREAVLSILLLAATGSAVAQSEPEKVSGKISLEWSYFECASPPDCKCFASTEEKKKTCPECKEWAKKFMSSPSFVSFEVDEFTYSKIGKPSNRLFLNEVAVQLYDTELPKTAEGFPVSAAQLYRNPEKYGFVQLGPDDPKAGALAVWPSMGGVVLEESEASANWTDLKILYPSDKESGRLVVEEAQYLSVRENPKFVVPESLTVEALDVVIEDASESAAPPP